MKGKAVIPLALGLGMGFIAIKMGINVIRKAQGKPTETVDVVVAARPIDAAASIDERMLRLAPVPVALVPPGSFRETKQLAGRVPLVTIMTGMPVSNEMLAPVGAEPGLPSQIPEGYRAVSVGVDESTAVAGFVMPGHRVDVYATDSVQRGPTGMRSVSRLLLEDVQVGAVGQSIKTVDPDGKASRLTRSVTVYVRPEDVPSLDVASRSQIRLALRGTQDRSNKVVVNRTLRDGLRSLLRSSPKASPDASASQPRPEPVVLAPQPAFEPTKPHVVEIYRGDSVERVTFQLPDSIERSSAADSAFTPANPFLLRGSQGASYQAPVHLSVPAAQQSEPESQEVDE